MIRWRPTRNDVLASVLFGASIAIMTYAASAFGIFAAALFGCAFSFGIVIGDLGP